MQWTRTASQQLDLHPDQVWRIVGDPTALPRWQPQWQSVSLDSAAAPGATGRLTPAGRLRGRLHQAATPPYTILTYQPSRRLTLEQRQPGGRWELRFRIEGNRDGCLLTQQHVYTGVAAGTTAGAFADDLTDFDWRCVRLRAQLGAPPASDAQRVVIAGGTGLLGRHLAADLVCRGHQVEILSRRDFSAQDLPHLQHRMWHTEDAEPDWAEELFDDPARTSVVNLAGKLVGARPTAANIEAFRTSRVASTRALLRGTAGLPVPLRSWVQSSTTAIWGDAGEQRCTETTPIPYGPAALPQMTGVAAAWESAFTSGPPRAQNATILRTSLVLSRDAPIVAQLAGFARVGLGGPMGDGRQWVSWIALADWLHIVRAALGLDPDLSWDSPVVVAASPHPERNIDMMRLVRRAWRRLPAPPTPRPLAIAGGWLLGVDPALGLTGRHATSTVLAEAGFEFSQPRLSDAIHALWS